MSKEKKARFQSGIAAFLFLMLVPLSCGTQGKTAGPAGTAPGASAAQGRTVELPAVEVRSFEGKNLSSVDDFSENSIQGPRKVDLGSYRLQVAGLVKTPLSLRYEETLAHPAYSKAVTLNCVEGWSATILWEGIRLSDLLAQAGYDPSATTVIFTAHDGYTTSLPLDYIVDRDILLAAKMNGIAMPAERGYPFTLVAEDKWGYKWIKWVTKIEVSRDTAFRGYWESRGYSQEGEYGGPMFE